jgi:hypothetical protein
MFVFLLMLLIDRGRIWLSHYQYESGDAEWAHDTLKSCNGNKPYSGRRYNKNCLDAQNIVSTSPSWRAFVATLEDTHMCIWWDCSHVLYALVTSPPLVVTLGVAALIVLFLCGNRNQGPQAITLVPNFAHSQVGTREAPLSSPSIKTIDSEN